MEASRKSFLEGLRERYSDVERRLDLTISELASATSINEREVIVEKLTTTCKNLWSYLASDDRPLWLKQILQAIQDYQANRQIPDASKNLVGNLLTVRSDLKPILADELGGPKNIDFDSIFEQYRSEGQLETLFDQLIDIVGKIISSNAVDSVQTLRGLNDLLDLLKANRKNSFAATKWTIFSARFIWSLFVEGLKEVPVLKQGIAAFEKTLEKTEKEFNDTQLRMEGAVRERLSTSFKPPVALTSEAFDGFLLEGPEDVIDGEFTVEETPHE